MLLATEDFALERSIQSPHSFSAVPDDILDVVRSRDGDQATYEAFKSYPGYRLCELFITPGIIIRGVSKVMEVWLMGTIEEPGQKKQTGLFPPFVASSTADWDRLDATT
ncbi:hypothetical protein PG984_002708 [Apiospora sp. TS-2023a]